MRDDELLTLAVMLVVTGFGGFVGLLLLVGMGVL
jgi:hypothetical protein